jgi:hypothetical protein
MELEALLWESVEQIEETVGRKLDRELSKLAAAVCRNIVLSNIDLEATRSCVPDDLHDAAEVLDAAALLKDIALAPCYGRVLDVPLPSTMDGARDALREPWKSGSAPDRAFCYVAWRAKPLQFLYIGKASQRERLDLHKHGLLALCVGRATRVSLVFPSRGTPETLALLEGALLRVAKFRAGDLPELNEVLPRLDRGHAQGSDRLEAAARFLHRVGSALRPFRGD